MRSTTRQSDGLETNSGAPRRIGYLASVRYWLLVALGAISPWSAVILWASVIYVFVNFGELNRFPPSLSVYVIQPLLWTSAALMGYLGWRYGIREKPALSWPLALGALLVGLFQVATFALDGVIYGFGYSPYGHRPLVILGNLTYAVSILVAVELCRATVVVSIGRRRPVRALMVAALFFTLLGIPFARLSSIDNGPTFLRVLGETFLPAFSENLLASLLVLLGGPLAAIAYRAPLLLFEWLSPILPKQPWLMTAFLGTLVPALGLLVIHSMGGARAESPGERKGASSSPWLLVAGVSVILIWFNAGLFGVQPTLVSGVSMEPALRAGDVAVTRDVEPEAVDVGDIVRFREGGLYVLHRVVEIREEAGQRYFITQGDANNVEDAPLPARELEGKVVFVIPKIGWLGIAVRKLIEWVL